MVAIRIRDTEACDRQPQLLWDTIWVQRLDASGGYGDWILAGADDQVDSRGGLRAEQAIHTATMLCLFTDRRAEDDDVLPTDDGDRRGWWGDSIRLNEEPEVPLGSRLWLLERAVLTDRTPGLAKDYAEEALAVLADQAAVARTEVETWSDATAGALYIAVRHYSHDGTRTYDQRFGVLWAQTSRAVPMNFGDTLFV
ncbi:MAG: phage GP46 family protein [Hyphomicrobiaceae bacterium]